MPSFDETRAFFDAVARRYDRDYAPPSSVTRARMTDVLKLLGAPKRVLDLGVGTGRELTSLQDAGHAVTGVDASPQMLALCNKRSRTIPVHLTDFWGRLPSDDGAFDVVIALFGSLAHPPDAGAPARLAREVARVLSGGGLFVFEMPTPAWIDSLPASAGEARALVRTERFTARHHDAISLASIDIVTCDEAAWRTALVGFDVTFAYLDAAEVRVVATRR